MTTLLRRGATRTLLAVALATAPLALTTQAHAADPSATPATGTYKSGGVGYDYVIDGHSAGTDVLTINGKAVEVFCIQYAVPSATTGTFTATPWANAGVSNLDKIADIAAHHATTGTPLTDPRAENTAAQLAIWKFSDNLDFTAVPNADIVSRASALVTAAKVATSGPVGLSVTASATLDGAKNTAQASVRDTTGAPVTGQAVTFTFDNDATVTVPTDANGVATTSVDAPQAAGTARADVAGTLPSGTVMVPEGGKQKVITTTAVDLEAVAADFATLAAPVADTPAPEPAPAQDPAPEQEPAAQVAAQAPTAEAVPDELPFTGGFGTVGIFAGLAALTAAAVIVRFKLRPRP